MSEKQTIRDIERQIEAKKVELSKLEKKAKYMRQNKKLVITDHALLRYLERSGKIDFEAIKNTLITEQVKRLHSILGDGTYPVGDGPISVVIQENKIVTVLIN